MSLGRRLSDLFSRRGRDEGDPLAELDASYRTQAEHLQQSRRGVADVVTARKRVELQVRSLESGAQRLHTEAQHAVSAGRDDAARKLLVRRAGLLEQAAALQPDLDRLNDQEARLQAQVQRLEAKVEAFRTQKETLKATHSAAEAHHRIGEAWAGISEESADVGLAVARARERTDAVQARADAMEQLAGGPSARPWETAGQTAERRMAELSAGEDGSVDAELARLKSGDLAGPGTTGRSAERAT